MIVHKESTKRATNSSQIHQYVLFGALIYSESISAPATSLGSIRKQILMTFVSGDLTGPERSREGMARWDT